MWSIGSGGSVCKKGRIHLVAVVTAATGVKGCFWCRSSGQGQFSNSVTAVKMFTFCTCVLHKV